MRDKKRFVRIMLVFLITITFVSLPPMERSSLAQDSGYSIFDLGTLGGAESYAGDINDLGQVVGHSRTASGSYPAFLWTPSSPNATTGSMSSLGTLGGWYSYGSSINALGQVAGGSNTTDDEDHAILWSPSTPNGSSGSMIDLGGLGGSFYQAFSINDRGQVAGYSFVDDVPTALHAFLWTPHSPNGNSGSITDLGTLGSTFSEAYSVNSIGQVAGDSDTNDGTFHAFLWNPETPNGTLGTMVDIGSLGDSYIEAFAINDQGQVAGDSYNDDGSHHAFLWTPTTPNGTTGTMISLGALGGSYSAAQGINDAGQVVGWAESADGSRHAFLWTPTTPNGSSGSMVDLGTLGGSESGAYGINAAGEIVGNSEMADGSHHATLWVPTKPSKLELNLTTSMNPAQVDGTELYTISISNSGASSVADVTLTAAVSAGDVVEVDGQDFTVFSPGNCTLEVYKFTCHLGDLPALDNVRVLASVTPAQVGALSFSAHISGSAADVVVSDDALSSVTVVAGPKGQKLARQLKDDAGIHATGTGIQLVAGALGDVIGGTIGGSVASGSVCVFLNTYVYSPHAGFATPANAMCVGKAASGALNPVFDVTWKLQDAYEIYNGMNVLLDPPDPDFTSVTRPSPPAIPTITRQTGLTGAEAAAINQYFHNQAWRIAYEQALLTAVERSQGAANAGNLTWERIQAFEAATYAELLAINVQQEPRLLAGFEQALIAAGAHPVPLTPDMIRALQRHVATVGLPESAIQALTQIGATPEEISLARTLVQVANPESFGSTSINAFDEQYASDLRGFVGCVFAGANKRAGCADPTTAGPFFSNSVWTFMKGARMR